jgi:hypothetical protein
MMSLPHTLKSAKAFYVFLEVGTREREFLREARPLQIHSSIDPKATRWHQDTISGLRSRR